MRILFLATLLSATACAHQRGAAPPQDPTSPELVELKRENVELKRKISHLEDRLVQVSGEAPGPDGRGLPVVRLRPAGGPIDAEPAKASPTRVGSLKQSVTLKRAEPATPPEPETALGYGTGTGFTHSPGSELAAPASAPEAPLPEVDDGRKSYRLEGSRLVSLTKSKRPPPAPAPPRGQKKQKRSRRGDKVIGAYEDAMELLKAGEHDAAYAAFDAIARKHPRHDYADNALYWKGEAAYDQGRFADALAAFTAVVETYGGGNKAPDALLKIGLCYHKVGDQANAVDVLTELIAAYPRARATDIARLKLAEFQG